MTATAVKQKPGRRRCRSHRRSLDRCRDRHRAARGRPGLEVAVYGQS